MKSAVVRFALGLGVSICVHALLLSGTCALFGGDAPEAADELPKLDVTSVDLSFSEEETETAPPSVSQPAAPETVLPEPELLPPPMPEPPMLTVPAVDDEQVVRTLEDVRVTELKPRELEAPETEMKEPLPDEREEKEEKPQMREKAESVPQSAAAPAPQQARVDAPPSPKRTIKPKYPEGARKRGEQGDVSLELEVDVHGIVVGVKVVGGCGFAELEQAAVAAVRKALFRPAKRGNDFVSSRARLTLEFRLKR